MYCDLCSQHKKCGNYSREEIIQGQKLFAEIFQVEDIDLKAMFWKFEKPITLSEKKNL